MMIFIMTALIVAGSIGGFLVVLINRIDELANENNVTLRNVDLLRHELRRLSENQSNAFIEHARLADRLTQLSSSVQPVLEDYSIRRNARTASGIFARGR